jgi:hypothetical protein
MTVEENHATYEKPKRTVGVVVHGHYADEQLQREHTSLEQGEYKPASR